MARRKLTTFSKFLITLLIVAGVVLGFQQIKKMGLLDDFTGEEGSTTTTTTKTTSRGDFKDEDVIKESGYSRSEMWVRPDIWLMVKAKFYDKKGKFLKELTTGDIEQIDGIWTIKKMHMVNEKKKHQTIFTFSDIQYNTNLDDNIFSQRQLTKGIK